MTTTPPNPFAPLLKSLHLDTQSTTNYLKSDDVCNSILHTLKIAFPNAEAELLDSAEVVLKDLSAEQGTLFVQLALAKKTSDAIIQVISTHILNGDLESVPQLNAALDFFVKKKNPTQNYDVASFEENCGVGVKVTNEEIEKAVQDFLAQRKEKLVKDRYLTKVGPLLGQLSSTPRMKWADKKQVKKSLDDALVVLWGPQTEADKKREKDSKKKEKKEKKEKKGVDKPKKEIRISNDFAAREIPDAVNPPHLLQKHKEVTGGKVMTRFPPEPNGFLHIGHAKAINLSFTHAAKQGGHCYLRYDDTNPTKEEDQYFKSIKDMVEWLGFKPWKVTYSSEYFDEMYELAVKLIKKGLAYVDFQDKDTINAQRKESIESPYRNTSVEVNLKRFTDMRDGRYAEGEAVLRCKIDMKSTYFSMRDFIAYRIMYVPHPHIGDKWCIYPTYDYTHCIVDSLENVTHSLCTLEFEVRRDSYYWLLAALDLYRPHVWEFSRLNVSTSLLSKRKINMLVSKKIVRDWNDPRLLTLAGLRRRGYTKDAILNFCAEVGVTRSENLISIQKLESECKKDLDVRANRAFCVLRPLRVVLTNYPEDKVEYVEAPNHPKDESRGSRKLPLSRIVYIDERDFREEDEPSYFGLAPGKTVGLRYGPLIKCVSHKKDDTGKVVELHAEVVPKEDHPKAKYIHWLAQPQPGVDPEKVEARILDYLFKVPEDPKQLAEYLPPREEGDLLKEINPNSEIVYANAFIDPIFKQNPENRKVYTNFQFERVGFFAVDEDTTPEHLVFNLTLSVGGKKKSAAKKSDQKQKKAPTKSKQ
uniref:glutamine--tRNA ligase n=1 Tax=Percolomonas cosmopolitus TaxID=63605 RepID=A0A7S1PGD6_9EUKA